MSNGDPVFVGERPDDKSAVLVYVLYHSTRAANAESILANGFDLSKARGGNLGHGIYASADLEKSKVYGPVTFKLLVYTGEGGGLITFIE